MRAPIFTICTLLLTTPVMADEKAETFAIQNMTCALCSTIVHTALERVSGVHTVMVDREAQTARVTYEDTETSPQVLTTAARNAGYPAHRIAK